MKQYTTLDLELINSGIYTKRELAEILERTEVAIQSIAKRLNLKPKTNKISKYEIEFITNNKRRGNLWIAKSLGITKNRAAYIQQKLGLASKNEFWTEEDSQFLLDNKKNMTDDELSRVLGRTRSAVSNRLRKLGAKR